MSRQQPQNKGGLRQLWKNRYLLNESRLPTDLKSFLPPSLEVVEKPPHPLPRILLIIITTICAFGILWSIVGKVNVITVAEGKIIPTGKVKEIQPYDRGVITRIWVTEGQFVEEGQALIELDQTQITAEETRILNESLYIGEKKIRYEIMLDLLNHPEASLLNAQAIMFHPGLDGDLENGRQLWEEFKSILSQWQALEYQLSEKKAELLVVRENIRQLQATLPLIEERLEIYQKLFDQKLANINEYLSIKEERFRQYYSLEAEKARFKQIEAAISGMEKQIEAQKSQNVAQTLEELDDLNRQTRSLAQELIQVRDLGSKQILYAPVNGTVKGLITHTVGGVVTSAQVLMEIVPLDEVLEVEAFISNQDIGYVRTGQNAEIKVNTFPFTKYGVIDAVVANVASDATVDENLGLIYRARLTMEKNTIRVDGKDVPLMPGMAVSAEIATDQRRLIEFFLAPLLKMHDESLRER